MHLSIFNIKYTHLQMIWTHILTDILVMNLLLLVLAIIETYEFKEYFKYRINSTLGDPNCKTNCKNSKENAMIYHIQIRLYMLIYRVVASKLTLPIILILIPRSFPH